jgi:hypothetical protein
LPAPELTTSTARQWDAVNVGGFPAYLLAWAFALVGASYRVDSAMQPAPDIELPDRAFLEFQTLLELLFHNPSPELSLFV